jgi:formylglycine-generating enzyme required for sulfatase activity
VLLGAAFLGRGALFAGNAEYEHAPPPAAGTTFTDCPSCPEMVVVPAGEFMMGSPESEQGRAGDEGPVHRVSIRQRFAIGKVEVTFAEWDACVADGGCDRYRPQDRGWGRGKRPVINVSWRNAMAYAAWLSLRTGFGYRLPSEAEWEYAARARTETARYWGEAADGACEYENVHDMTSKRVNRFDWEHHECDDDHAQTAPVGWFEANGFGLHDMLGIVWEWVEDCWHDSYAGAPSDGNARTRSLRTSLPEPYAPWPPGDCSARVLRGGSWNNFPQAVRSANRDMAGIDSRGSSIGFRVARTLP